MYMYMYRALGACAAGCGFRHLRQRRRVLRKGAGEAASAEETPLVTPSRLNKKAVTSVKPLPVS